MTNSKAGGYTTGTIHPKGIELTVMKKPLDKTKERLQIVTKYISNGITCTTVGYKNGWYWVRDDYGRYISGGKNTLREANAIAKKCALEMIMGYR